MRKLKPKPKPKLADFGVTFDEYTAIADWVDANLFGDRTIAPDLPLTPAQRAIRGLAIEIISRWETRVK